MRKPVITVVGSFAVGLTIRTNHMPIFGETLIGSDFDMGPGGKGSNQAVGCARLGADAYFAGIIGDDKLGEIASELYGREGVNVRYLTITRAAPTGVGIIILDPGGKNGIILDMGANKLMDEAFVDRVEEQIAGSDAVMSVLELPVPAALRAMELGRKHGARTILNPAPATRLEPAALRNVDYLTPNETELRILLGLKPDDPTPTPDLARRLHDGGVGHVIVTMGEAGALVLSGGEDMIVPAAPAEVVDTTGAGDAFNAALAVALAEDRPLVEAVQFAACAGALECGALGVIPGLPGRQDVERFYDRQFRRLGDP